MNDERTSKILSATALAAITFLMYLSSFSNQFLKWDDYTYIVNNQFLRQFNFPFLQWAFTTYYFSNWHPLTWISYAADYALWGLNPLGYHLTNALLHSANTALVFFLILHLFHSRKDLATEMPATPLDVKPRIVAALSAILFGLHPLHVESVAWISERKDVLYAFFFLLSILSYLRFASASQTATTGVFRKPWRINRSYILSLLFFVCSLLSKPMAVSLPLVLIILDWYPLERLERSSLTRVLTEKLPFALFGLSSSLLTIHAQQQGGSLISFSALPFLPRLLTGMRSIVAYLSKILVPIDLSPFYPYTKGVVTAELFSYEYLIPFLMVIGVTTICIYWLKRQKIWAAAWSYYIVTLLPVLGIVQVGGQAMGDRYTYLPSLGPFLLVAIALQRLMARGRRKSDLSATARKVISLFSFLCLTLSLSFLTVEQIRVWQNDETLWSRVLAIYPEVADAYKNRGVYYRIHRQYEKALNDFTRGIAISPGDFAFYTNRALTYIRLGEPERALKDANRAIELDPHSWKTYSTRGKLYSMLGRYYEALEDYSRALQMVSAPAELFNSRGNIYAKLGLFEAAVNDYSQAIRNSSWPRREYYYNRSTVYMAMGLSADAAKDFTICRGLPNTGDQNLE